MPSIAAVSGESRRGVVYTEGGETYLIEQKKPNQPELAGRRNIHYWLLADRPLRELDAGEHPFEAAYRALDEAVAEVKQKPCAIRIVVSKDHGFIGYVEGCAPESCHRLFGATTCVQEILEVWRDDDLFDVALLRHIGTHADYDGFEGFWNLFGQGTVYRQDVRPEHFAPGDVLLIREVPRGVSPYEYWVSMSLGKAKVLT